MGDTVGMYHSPLSTVSSDSRHPKGILLSFPTQSVARVFQSSDLVLSFPTGVAANKMIQPFHCPAS